MNQSGSAAGLDHDITLDQGMESLRLSQIVGVRSMSEENMSDVEYASIRDSILCVGQRLSEEPAPYWISDQLPWRQERTPYRVFLAEFLLVRTHTRAVANVFEKIVSRYPNLGAIASADEAELADALKTLGFKKRAQLLVRAARYLLEEHDGQIPEETDELVRVPGLGPYTAAAIAAFAYGSPDVPADVNLLRLVARFTGLPMKHPTKGSKDLRDLLELLSQDLGGPKPESLLDFSRKVCRPTSPRCTDCPLSRECMFFNSVG